MITRFQKLFQVEIWHDYYGGPSFDFTFLVPLETAEQLRNGRLIAKCHDGRLAVFFAAKEGAEPCVFLAGRRLDFALRLTNPDFPNFTKPDGNATREAYTVPRFTNEVDPVKLAKAKPGSVPSSLAAEAVYGLVSIGIARGFYQDPPDFRIHFEARKERLRYHVWLRKFSEGDLAALAITTKGAAQGTGEPAIVFKRMAPKADTGAGVVTTPAKVVEFESTTEIPRSARSEVALELRKNGEVLIPNLPRPSPGQPSADVFIHVSKP